MYLNFLEPHDQLWRAGLVVEVVITADRPDLLKRKGSTKKPDRSTSLGFPLQIWIPDWRSCLIEATRILRIGWKKRPNTF
jgi:hypothetical protein